MSAGPPRIVAGLGNPGKEYERTRHNVGFMVVDEVARRFGLTAWKTKDNARQIFDSTRRVVLVEPLSYMNLSGAPVRLIASWYRTPPQDVLAIVDDMDIPFGAIRMRPSGGHGGHNGLRSMIATMTDAFPRLRIGVGRPEYDGIDHVLGQFTPAERETLPAILGAAADVVELWLDTGLDRAMQAANTWTMP